MHKHKAPQSTLVVRSLWFHVVLSLDTNCGSRCVLSPAGCPGTAVHQVGRIKWLGDGGKQLVFIHCRQGLYMTLKNRKEFSWYIKLAAGASSAMNGSFTWERHSKNPSYMLVRLLLGKKSSMCRFAKNYATFLGRSLGVRLPRSGREES